MPEFVAFHDFGLHADNCQVSDFFLVIFRHLIFLGLPKMRDWLAGRPTSQPAGLLAGWLIVSGHPIFLDHLI